jgi:hypothetical protein
MSDKMITVKMPLGDVMNVRGMLVFERIMTEGDFEDVAALHNGLAVGAAREVLHEEVEKFSRIIGFIDESLDASGKRPTINDLAEKFSAVGVLDQEEGQ